MSVNSFQMSTRLGSATSFQAILPTSNLITDEQLMAACAGGDRHAFDELHRRYGAFILNFVQRKITDRGHAEDVVQETFLRLYRSARSFDVTRQLRRWLFTIAANEVRRYWSRNGQTVLSLSRSMNDEEDQSDFQDLLADSGPSPEDEQFNQAVSAKLREAIIALPEFQRTALIMRAYKNMTLQQISEATHTPVATVNSRMHYATEKLRRVMRETGFVGQATA